MKAGKFLLGFTALDAVVKDAPDNKQAMELLAGLASEAMVGQQQALGGTQCGFSTRARYIEGMTAVGMQPMNGYLLEFKVGPNPVIDDESKYAIKQFFCEHDSLGKLKQVHRIETNLNDQDPM